MRTKPTTAPSTMPTTAPGAGPLLSPLYSVGMAISGRCRAWSVVVVVVEASWKRLKRLCRVLAVDEGESWDDADEAEIREKGMRRVRELIFSNVRV